MKKILIVFLCLIVLCSCSNNKVKWNTVDLIEYTKGEIIYSESNEVQINNTTYKDLENYLKALETITYTYIDTYENNNPFYMTNGTKYIKIEYIDSHSDNYAGHNVKINVYNSESELK